LRQQLGVYESQISQGAPAAEAALISALQAKVRTMDADNRGLVAIRNSHKLRIQMLEGKCGMLQDYSNQLKAFVELHHPEAVALLQASAPRSPVA
jgi:hypothetical protein